MSRSAKQYSDAVRTMLYDRHDFDGALALVTEMRQTWPTEAADLVRAIEAERP